MAAPPKPWDPPPGSCMHSCSALGSPPQRVPPHSGCGSAPGRIAGGVHGGLTQAAGSALRRPHTQLLHTGALVGLYQDAKNGTSDRFLGGCRPPDSPRPPPSSGAFAACEWARAAPRIRRSSVDLSHFLMVFGSFRPVRRDGRMVAEPLVGFPEALPINPEQKFFLKRFAAASKDD